MYKKGNNSELLNFSWKKKILQICSYISKGIINHSNFLKFLSHIIQISFLKTISLWLLFWRLCFFVSPVIPLSHLKSWYPFSQLFMQVPLMWLHWSLSLQFPHDLLQFSPYFLPSHSEMYINRKKNELIETIQIIIQKKGFLHYTAKIKDSVCFITVTNY